MDRRTLLKSAGFVGLLSGTAGTAVAACAPQTAPTVSQSSANQTRWTVRPAIGLDACFALTIAAAPETVLQVHQHLSLRPKLRDLLGNEGVAAADTLMQALARAGRGATPGPGLAYVVSAGKMASLDDVIETFAVDGILDAGLADDPEYSNPRARENIARVRPIAQAAFQALKDGGYEALWRAESAPKLETAATALAEELQSVDVIRQHRKYLTRDFDPSVTLFVSELSEPHGIKITGQRFVTSPNYPALLVRRIATHEMMHRLLDPNRPETARILSRMNEEPLLRAVLAKADASFGYTSNRESVRGLIEEGGVQALEAVINENLDQARAQSSYWQGQDGGMHVFAAATYAHMHATGFAEQGGDFLAWLDQQTANGALRGARLEHLAASIIGEAAVHNWLAPAPDG